MYRYIVSICVYESGIITYMWIKLILLHHLQRYHKRITTLDSQHPNIYDIL